MLRLAQTHRKHLLSKVNHNVVGFGLTFSCARPRAVYRIMWIRYHPHPKRRFATAMGVPMTCHGPMAPAFLGILQVELMAMRP